MCCKPGGSGLPCGQCPRSAAQGHTPTMLAQVAGLVGDPGVGGIHFDARLVQHCRSAFLRRHGIDLSSHPRAMARLRAACERAKRELSAASRATIALEELASGHSFVITIARSEFEEMCEDLLQRCSDAVDRVGGWALLLCMHGKVAVRQGREQPGSRGPSLNMAGCPCNPLHRCSSWRG